MSRFNLAQSVALFGGCVLLAGCAVTPNVKYDVISSANPRQLADEEFDAYYLQGSEIKIAAAPLPKQQSGSGNGGNNAPAASPAEAPEPFLVESIPIEAEGLKLTLSHDDSFWETTNLKISRMPNKDLVLDIGSQVTDHRIEYINDLSTIVQAGAKFVAAGAPAKPNKPQTPPPPPKLPIYYNLVQEFRNRANNGTDDPKGFPITFGTDIPVTVNIGPLPPDAVPFRSQDFPQESHAFLYAACRTAEVKAKIPNGTQTVELDTIVKVADPNYLQRVMLPDNGLITMQSECGVSVQTGPSTVSDTMAVATAFAAQASADKAAIDAAAGAKPPSKGKK